MIISCALQTAHETGEILDISAEKWLWEMLWGKERSSLGFFFFQTVGENDMLFSCCK